MCQIGNCLNIRNIQLGITYCLSKNKSRFIFFIKYKEDFVYLDAMKSPLGKIQKKFILNYYCFMKKNLTEIVFILDRSGSMHGLEQDTVGGFNSLIEKQKAE